MKVAFILPKWPTKNEVPIINQIVELKNQGVQEMVFYAFDKDSKDIMKDVQLLTNVHKTIYIPQPKLNRFKNKVINKLFIIFKALPLLIKTLFLYPKIFYQSIFYKSFGEYRSAFKIIYAVQPLLKNSSNYDIVHCQYGPYGIWGSIFDELGLIKGKLITSFRGYDINKLPTQKPNNFYSFLINKGSLFTSNSNFTKNNAIKLGFPEQKIKVIRTALNISKYNYLERNYSTYETFQVLTIAALRTLKGIEYSIRAIKIVLEKHPDITIKYRIAGEGYLRENLQDLINSLGLKSNVELLGFVNHDELNVLYNKAHLFILPSIKTKNGNQEAQGLVLQEAQLSGIPVIGTNTGGIPEGIVDGASGFIVEPENPEEIAEKISYFIKQPKEIVTFGKQGKVFVTEKFNLETETSKLIRYYEGHV